MLKLRARRSPTLFWSYYSPYAAIGVLTSLLLSLPATLLYAIIGEMISDPGGKSLGRFIVGTLPKGQLQQLGMVAFSLFALGAIIWIFLSWSRRRLLSRLRLGEREPDEFGTIFASSGLDAALVPVTSLVIILLALAVGGHFFGDGMQIRSPEVAIASIGSDYISTAEVLGMTLGLFEKALIASLFAASIGYLLSVSLPSRFVSLRSTLLASAFAVQIIPIVVIAALLWIIAPDLGYREIIVATLSGLYPAFQLMQERRSQMPGSITELLIVRAENRIRTEVLVYFPWTIAALPTVILAVAPITVNAVLASEYILRGDGIGRWLYAIHARGETTMVYGFFILVVTCSLLTVTVLVIARQIAERSVLRRKVSVHSSVSANGVLS